MKPEKKEKKSQLNTLARFSGVGVQMAVTIWLGAELGKWLDIKYPNDHEIYTIVCTLLAVGISLYSLIVQANKTNN